jgi:hypothetical protein
VRKYVQTDAPPAYVRSKNKESKLDTFKPFIRERLKEYPLSAAGLLSEIREQGYRADTPSSRSSRAHSGMIGRSRPRYASRRLPASRPRSTG